MQNEWVGLTPSQILEYIPQTPPFRFIDEIQTVNEESIVGSYTFKKEEFFYAGHFKDEPITPGVILLESMCQVGVVAFGIYLLSKEIPLDQMKGWLTLFTDAQVEFSKSVYPGETVIIRAEKVFWRRMKLKAAIEMYNQDQVLVAHTTASGIGVKR